MIREAIVLAGGFGTRLQSVVSDVPKPMAPVAGKPFLNYILDYLLANKIERVVLSVGHMAQKIIDIYGAQYNELEILYSVEESPLGTGGAIKKSLGLLNGASVLILNGDSFFGLDIELMYQTHIDKKADVTFGLKEMHDFDRYGSIRLNEETKQVLSFNEKEKLDVGLINSGVYIFRSTVFENLELPEKFSLEEDFFKLQTEKMNFIGHVCAAYFVDIGIPEDYKKAQEYFSN